MPHPLLDFIRFVRLYRVDRPLLFLMEMRELRLRAFFAEVTLAERERSFTNSVSKPVQLDFTPLKSYAGVHQLLYKPGRGTGKETANVGWHQDYVYWQCCKEPTLISVWVAFTDVDLSNGWVAFKWLREGERFDGDAWPILYQA